MMVIRYKSILFVDQNPSFAFLSEETRYKSIDTFTLRINLITATYELIYFDVKYL